MDAGTARRRLVDGLVAGGRIRSAAVEAAFRAVPRHLFLPGLDPVRAYEDAAIPTHWDPAGRPTSSSSQPSIMALMLEQLDVRPGHRVLEIGTGTGYNAALLAHLAGPDGQVTTIDIAPDVSAAATAHLRAASLHPVAAAPPRAGRHDGPGPGDGPGPALVRVVVGDGAAGWPEGAPYDRVILTAAARDLAPAWVEQLAGRLVLPLALRGVQHSVAFERAGDCLTSVSVVGCGFMALRGDLAGPDTMHPLEPGLYLEVEGPAVRVDLSPRGRPVPVLAADPAEVGASLRQWLALREPGAGLLVALDRSSPVPPLTTGGGADMTVVLVEDGALAAVVPGGDGTIAVQAYGSGDGPADRLLAAVRAWDAAGRPGSAGLRIRACAPGTDPGGAEVVDAPHTRFLLDHP